MSDAVAEELEHLKVDLRRAAEPEPTALLLYGSNARGDFVVGRSDINVLVCWSGPSRMFCGPSGRYCVGLVAARLESPLVTEHLAFVRGGGLEAGHLLPLPRTRAMLEILIENIGRAQAVLPVPLREASAVRRQAGSPARRALVLVASLVAMAQSLRRYGGQSRSAGG